MQTSSVCLRRQLPRRGKPRKGELRRALLQRGKPRKERKSAETLEWAKRGKGWCGGWSRPLQSACADSFPEGGSRERANCAEGFYREESRERNERQPRCWKGQSGEKVDAVVGADLFSLLAQTASPKGKAEKGRIAQSASTEGESRERNERQPRRWKGQSREGQERFRGGRA